VRFLFVALPDRDRDERPEALPPRDGVPFELADRISRTSSVPAATAPRIMPARSSWRTAVRTPSTARCSVAIFRLEALFVRWWRQPPVPGNFDEAAKITVAGPTLIALTRVFIAFISPACGSPRQGITAFSPRGRARARRPPIAVRRVSERMTRNAVRCLSPGWRPPPSCG
jgi:hypothetical protein